MDEKAIRKKGLELGMTELEINQLIDQLKGQDDLASELGVQVPEEPMELQEEEPFIPSQELAVPTAEEQFVVEEAEEEDFFIEEEPLSLEEEDKVDPVIQTYVTLGAEEFYNPETPMDEKVEKAMQIISPENKERIREEVDAYIRGDVEAIGQPSRAEADIFSEEIIDRIENNKEVLQKKQDQMMSMQKRAKEIGQELDALDRIDMTEAQKNRYRDLVEEGRRIQDKYEEDYERYSILNKSFLNSVAKLRDADVNQLEREYMLTEADDETLQAYAKLIQKETDDLERRGEGTGQTLLAEFINDTKGSILALGSLVGLGDEKFKRYTKEKVLNDALVPSNLKKAIKADYVDTVLDGKRVEVRVDDDGNFIQAYDPKGFQVDVSDDAVKNFNRSGIGKNSESRVSYDSLIRLGKKQALELVPYFLGGGIATGVAKKIGKSAIKRYGKKRVLDLASRGGVAAVAFGQTIDDNLIEAINEYGDTDKARNIAIGKSSLTAALTALLPGVERLPMAKKIAIDKAIKAAATRRLPFADKLKSVLKSIGEEYVEEFSDQIGGNIIDIANGLDKSLLSEEEAFTVAVLTPVISTPVSVLGQVSSTRNAISEGLVAASLNKDFNKKYNDAVDALNESSEVKKQRKSIVNNVKKTMDTPVMKKLSEVQREDVALDIIQQEFLKQQNADPAINDAVKAENTKKINDLQEKINNAIQEQKPDEVPVRPEARVSEEVEEKAPEAKPEEPTTEVEEEEEIEVAPETEEEAEVAPEVEEKEEGDKEVVAEMIAEGDSKEDISKPLQDKGYTKEEADALVEQVAKETATEPTTEVEEKVEERVEGDVVEKQVEKQKKKSETVKSGLTVKRMTQIYNNLKRIYKIPKNKKVNTQHIDKRIAFINKKLKSRKPGTENQKALLKEERDFLLQIKKDVSFELATQSKRAEIQKAKLEEEQKEQARLEKEEKETQLREMEPTKRGQKKREIQSGDSTTEQLQALLDSELDKVSKRVVRAVMRAQKAIAKILPDVNIVVHFDRAIYNRVSGANLGVGMKGTRPNSRAVYNPQTTNVHIYLPNANARTVAHEIFHAIIIEKLKTEGAIQEVTRKMVDDLRRILPKNSKLLKELDEFAENYRENIQNEERIAELFGILAEAYETAGREVKNVIDEFIKKLKELVVKIAKGLNVDTASLRILNESVEDTPTLLRTLAAKLATGEEIQPEEVSFGVVASEEVQKERDEAAKKSENGQDPTPQELEEEKSLDTAGEKKVADKPAVKMRKQLDTGTEMQVSGKEQIRSTKRPFPTKVKIDKEEGIVNPFEYKDFDSYLDETKLKSNSQYVGLAMTLAKGFYKYKKKTGEVVTVYTPYSNPKVLKKLQRLTEKNKNVKRKKEKDAISKQINDTTKAFLTSYRDSISQTILGLYDTLDPKFVKESKQWYEGANRFANFLARKYNLTLEQAGGIIGVLSPQKDWFTNVSNAERSIDVLSKHGDEIFTEEILDAAYKQFNRSAKKGQEVSSAEALRKRKSVFEGKTINQLIKEGLSDNDVAIALRAMDQAINSPSVLSTYPSGKNFGYTKTRVAWNSFSEIGRAINIFFNGKYDNISRVIGDGNKVRSFVNNIIDPQSKEGFLTADTHALSVALMLPISADDAGGAKLFTGGESAMYAIVEDAYRKAAAERNLLPREMQSVTWEAQRVGINNPNRKAEEKKRVVQTSKELENKGVSPYERAIYLASQNKGKAPNWAVSMGIDNIITQKSDVAKDVDNTLQKPIEEIREEEAVTEIRQQKETDEERLKRVREKFLAKRAEVTQRIQARKKGLAKRKKVKRVVKPKITQAEQKKKAPVIKKIKAILKAKKKKGKTFSGRPTTAGLDAQGQQFFNMAENILNLILNKQDAESKISALRKAKKSVKVQAERLKNIVERIASITNEVNEQLESVLEKQARGEELTRKESELIDKAIALDTFGNIESLTLEDTEKLLEEIKEERRQARIRLAENRAEFAEKIKEMQEEAVSQLKKGFGFLFNEDGTPKTENQIANEKKQIVQDLKKLKVFSALKKYFEFWYSMEGVGVSQWFKSRIAHLGTLTNILDVRGKWFTENIYNSLNRMFEAQQKGYFKQMEKLDSIANSIKGVTKGYRQIKNLMSRGVIEIIIKGKKEPFVTNNEQLARIYAISKNDVQAARLKDMGFDEEIIENIKNLLGPEVVEFVDKTVEYLGNEYFDGVNSVYQAINNVNLGYVENYFPVITENQESSSQMTDDGNFLGLLNIQNQSALKDRTDTEKEIKLDEGFSSALDNYFQSMEKFKAYAEGVKKITRALRNPAIQTVLEQTGMKGLLYNGIGFAVNPHIYKEKNLKLERIIDKFVPAVLAFKIIQIPKQATSFIQAYEDYSFRADGKKSPPGVDLLMYALDTGWVAITLPYQIKKAYKMSGTFRARIAAALEGDVVGLEAGRKTFTNISKSNTLWGKAIRAFKLLGAAPTVIGDALGVMGYMANYNRNIRNGMSQAKALEAFNNYNATQQTRRDTERSPIQRSNNLLTRAFTSFASTLFLQMNKVMQSAGNITRSLKDGKLPLKKDVRALILNYAVANVLFTFMSNLAMFIQGDEEDREEAMRRVKDAAMGLNLLYSIPLVGVAVENAILKARGERIRTGGGIVNPFDRLVKDVYEGLSEKDYELAVRKVLNIALGTNLDPFAAMYNEFGQDEFNEDFIYEILGISKSYRPKGKKKKSGDNFEDSEYIFEDDEFEFEGFEFDDEFEFED